jgi:hypothetical protein
MNTTELLGVFRQEVFDLELPYLWSDALIYTYIDDAQKQFCRKTYGIEDSRSFKITIKADGTEWYALDPSILKLRDAVDATTGSNVEIIAAEKLNERGIRFDGALGTMKVLVSGLDKGFVRAYPKPNQAAVVNLRTFRLPADVASGDDLEIDPQHHLGLLDWVKKKAYSVQDAETNNPKKAMEHEQVFEAYCAKSKVEQSRARRPVSTVTYGGI